MRVTAMETAEQQHQEALRLTEEARAIRALGGNRESVRLLQLALLRYAEAERLAECEGLEPNELWLRARAEACTLCAEWLEREDRPAEAARTYQEATDVWGLLADQPDSQERRKQCAHRAVACCRTLEGHPFGRLALLLVHYEHQLDLLSLRSDTEAEQAYLCMRIATTLFRRGYALEALPRYERAIELYAAAPATPTHLFAMGECHQALGRLHAEALENLERALFHYRLALALYHTSELAGEREKAVINSCQKTLADLLIRYEKHQ